MLTKAEQIRQTLKETREKRKSQTCRVYKVKVDESKLNKLQREQLKMLFVEGKRFYNHILNWAENEENDIFKFNKKECKSVLVLNKDKEFEEKPLEYLTSSLKLSIHEHICSSIKTISTLKKKGLQSHGGKLRFKSELNFLEYKQNGLTHKFRGENRVKLQGIKKPLYVRGMKQIFSQEGIEIANLHLLNTPRGYYLAITTYIDNNKLLSEQPSAEPIGIDFGCQTALTLSTGEKIKARVEESERLKRYQRKLARQQKGSNNYAKTKRIIGCEYQKLVNKRNDIANKVVARLKKHKLIVIQDEQLQNWAKSNHGKAISHSILGRVKEKLKRLPQTVVLDKFIPTTKLCVECGNIHEMSLRERTFKCPVCGCTADRDVHAATNMLWIAESLFNNLIRLGQTEFKRVEFLNEFSKFFEPQGTVKHEAARSLTERM